MLAGATTGIPTVLSAPSADFGGLALPSSTYAPWWQWRMPVGGGGWGGDLLSESGMRALSYLGWTPPGLESATQRGQEGRREPGISPSPFTVFLGRMGGEPVQWPLVRPDHVAPGPFMPPVQWGNAAGPVNVAPGNVVMPGAGGGAGQKGAGSALPPGDDANEMLVWDGNNWRLLDEPTDDFQVLQRNNAGQLTWDWVRAH